MIFSQWYPLDTEHESRSAFIERYRIVLQIPSGENQITFNCVTSTIKFVIPPHFFGVAGWTLQVSEWSFLRPSLFSLNTCTYIALSPWWPSVKKWLSVGRRWLFYWNQPNKKHNVKCTYSLQTLNSYTDMEFEVKLVKINSDISCTWCTENLPLCPYWWQPIHI